MLSFAKSFSFKVEGMCLQHLPTLSLKGNEPDGLQIEENLGRSKRHFFALWNELEPDVTSLFVGWSRYENFRSLLPRPWYCCDDQSCLQSFEFRDMCLTHRTSGLVSLGCHTATPFPATLGTRLVTQRSPCKETFFFSFFGRSVAWQPKKMLREWRRLRSDRKDYHSPPVLIRSPPRYHPLPLTHPAGNFALKMVNAVWVHPSWKFSENKQTSSIFWSSVSSEHFLAVWIQKPFLPEHLTKWEAS